MNKLMFAALAATSLAMPQLASAQAAPAAAAGPAAGVGIIDTQRAMNSCNACKTAITALEGQDNSLKAFGASIDKSVIDEQNSIQAALEAMPNKQPDAALQKRFDAWQKKREDSTTQFRLRAEQNERNRRFVSEQVNNRLQQAINAVIAKRNMALVFESAAIVRGPTAYDITADVLAQMNATTAPLSTTAPAGAARPAAATPRPAAPKPATTPKGR